MSCATDRGISKNRTCGGFKLDRFGCGVTEGPGFGRQGSSAHECEDGETEHHECGKSYRMDYEKDSRSEGLRQIRAQLKKKYKAYI